MKKYMMSLALVLALSLSFAIPAYAVDTETPEVSEEQYQSYLEIANQVSEERGIEIISVEDGYQLCTKKEYYD